jgi:hypothetical protein
LVRWGLGGVILVLLVLVVLNALVAAARVSDAVIGMALLVCGAALLFLLCFFVGIVRTWSWNAQHQYCPDCLRYMTRGANVCPFCGFRAEAAPPMSLDRAPAGPQT